VTALPQQPSAPPGVRYVLTVPQSVLFADLSLQGTKRPAYRTVFNIDYEPAYIAIDKGAMSWEFGSNEPFVGALMRDGSAAGAIQRFVGGMGSTARALRRAATALAPQACRRRGNAADLLQDLSDYWYVYELHMTNLWTYWSIEALLADALTSSLRAAGVDLTAGVDRFLQPCEMNYFALQRRHLRRLAERFVNLNGGAHGLAEGDEAESALQAHIDLFGFLLAPFNLGSPPVPATLREPLREAAQSQAGAAPHFVDVSAGVDDDLPPEARDLASLAAALTFWKTERLDVLALADSRLMHAYREVASLLELPLSDVFSMTKAEIAASLEDGGAIVEDEVLRMRGDGFCLVLYEGSVAFYEPGTDGAAGEATPLHPGESIMGVGASAGRASGKVKLILDLADIPNLETGDVLVAAMTRPEMGVALDRAAAFVTDEGGLMSHAAIISREMGKPCVIGTEVGTKRLRDGMTVTVDGAEGRVAVEASA
jgi:phosphohistidine swiveling domain-containing protein